MLLGAGVDTISDDYTLERKFAEFTDLGLDFVEAPLHSRDAETQAERYAALSAQYRIPVLDAVIAEFVKVPALPDDERGAAAAEIGRTVTVAADLGCDLVLLPIRVTPDEPARADAYAAALRRVLAATEATPVTLALEFVGGSRPREAAKLVEQMNDPRVTLFFDIGNCLYAGADPLADLTDLLAQVAQVHLKGGPTTPLAAMPLSIIRSILDAGEYRGRCAIEIEPPTGRTSLREAVSVLRMTQFWQPASRVAHDE